MRGKEVSRLYSAFQRLMRYYALQSSPVAPIRISLDPLQRYLELLPPHERAQFAKDLANHSDHMASIQDADHEEIQKIIAQANAAVKAEQALKDVQLAKLTKLTAKLDIQEKLSAEFGAIVQDLVGINTWQAGEFQAKKTSLLERIDAIKKDNHDPKQSAMIEAFCQVTRRELNELSAHHDRLHQLLAENEVLRKTGLPAEVAKRLQDIQMAITNKSHTMRPEEIPAFLAKSRADLVLGASPEQAEIINKFIDILGFYGPLEPYFHPLAVFSKLSYKLNDFGKKHGLPKLATMLYSCVATLAYLAYSEFHVEVALQDLTSAMDWAETRLENIIERCDEEMSQQGKISEASRRELWDILDHVGRALDDGLEAANGYSKRGCNPDQVLPIIFTRKERQISRGLKRRHAELLLLVQSEVEHIHTFIPQMWRDDAINTQIKAHLKAMKKTPEVPNGRHAKNSNKEDHFEKNNGLVHLFFRNQQAAEKHVRRAKDKFTPPADKQAADAPLSGCSPQV